MFLSSEHVDLERCQSADACDLALVYFSLCQLQMRLNSYLCAVPDWEVPMQAAGAAAGAAAADMDGASRCATHPA